MPEIAEYGSWKSPITPDIFSQGTSARITELVANKDRVLWVEQNNESGRGDLFVIHKDKDGIWSSPERLANGHNVQTSVHEYGGGALSMRCDGSPLFSTWDGLFWTKDYREIRQLVDGKENHMRFAEMESCGDYLFCVLEDHTVNESNPSNHLISVSLSEQDQYKIIASGADFYASPRVSPHGKWLLWMQWNHNNMPWDETSIMVARIKDDGTLADAKVVLNGVDKQVNYMQPSWSSVGKILVISDETNFWNLYEVEEWTDTSRISVKNVHPSDKEIGRPMWRLGDRHYASFGRVILLAFGDQLKILKDGTHFNVNCPEFSVFTHLRAIDEETFFCIGQGPKRSSSLLKIGFNGKDCFVEVLRESRSAEEIAQYPISVPHIVRFENDGVQISGWFFPPKNENYEGLPGTLPPVIILGHEGPTDEALNVLDFSQQFFTSRGFSIFYINHRGSAGFGHDFRKKLYGNWGIFDRDDIIAGARALISQKLVDPGKIGVMGGSAGGFLLLSSILNSEIFVAAVSNYGVADLESLTKDTHKFELHYVEQLVAKYPEERRVYQQRSPIEHLDRLHTPIAFFHGTEDKVVPKEHSIKIHETLKAKGIPTAIKLFPGEVHGFAGAKAVRESIEGAYYFFCKIMKIRPSLSSDLEIFNL